jgi:hypothetical protein
MAAAASQREGSPASPDLDKTVMVSSDSVDLSAVTITNFERFDHIEPSLRLEEPRPADFRKLVIGPHGCGIFG